jgi:hypothetical protein
MCIVFADFYTILAFVIGGGPFVLALAFIFFQSARGGRVVTFTERLLKDWGCLLPLFAFCVVTVGEYAFDVRFLQDPSHSQERPAFAWANPATDSAAATRVATSLYVLEMVDVTLSAAVIITIAFCFGLIYRLWNRTARKHRIGLFITVACVAEINYILWFCVNPLEDVLTNTLRQQADSIMALDEPLTALILATLIAIWLIAMTSGFIVASEAANAKEVQDQLNHLTVLLFLAAAVLTLFMCMLGASTLSAASLLGKDGPSDLVRQLALAESLNFGVFWSLFLAAIHYPSVWAVIQKPCADRLGEKDVSSPVHYYRKVATTISILAPVIVAALTKLMGSMIQ